MELNTLSDKIEEHQKYKNREESMVSLVYIPSIKKCITEEEYNELKKTYIFVPSLGLYMAREVTLQNKTWNQAHEELSKHGLRMPTIPEFIEFLKYTRDNDPDIYENMTAVRNPLRGEWLDAYFEQRDDGLYILTHDKTKAEELDPDILVIDRTPGIDLEDWLNNPTPQGLPRKDVKEGSLNYSYPRNRGVVTFGPDSNWAYLYHNWDPNMPLSWLGVRAVKNRI